MSVILPTSGRSPVITCPAGRGLSHGPGLSAAVAVLAGAACLVGWWGGPPWLLTLGVGTVPMMPNAALLAILTGLSLLAHTNGRGTCRRAAPVLAGMVLVLSLLTLAQYALDTDAGIDTLLAPGAGPAAMRPVPPTMGAFGLLAIALLVLPQPGRTAATSIEWLALTAAAVALMALLGLILSVRFPFTVLTRSPSGMAVPTMLALISLAAGLLGARRDGPMMSVLRSDELGATAARRLLSVLLVAPMLAASLQASVTQGWLSGPMAVTIGVFVAIVGMATAIVTNAGRLDMALIRRSTETEQLRLAAAVFDSSTEAIIITDAEARIVAVNPAFESLTGYSAREAVGRNPRFHGAGEHDTRFYQAMWERLTREGSWQGEIWNKRRNGEVYAAWENIGTVRDEQGQTTHYVALMSDITPIKQAEERLRHLAHHDPLTGLPNRLMFGSSLDLAVARAARTSERLALLLIDLDHFKLINDTLGHPAGDRLLTTVAERLRASVRASDMVARLGGDEFAVLIDSAGTHDDLAHLAQKIISLVAEPLTLEGRSVTSSCSIGIAVSPDDAADAMHLTRAADAALYRAKANGRHTFGFYTEELTRQAADRLAVEASLRRAVSSNELRLHYQPQFELVSGRFTGFEALVRWQHPEAGLLLPAEFIPVAEESHLIQQLTRWVIQESFRQNRAWLDAGLAPRRLSVNLSGRHFLHDHLAETLADAMHTFGIGTPASGVHVEVEVTETVFHSGERSAEVLQALRDMGVGVAIDDFGTGYSSLALLKKLPIDALKIPPLFVAGLPDDPSSHGIAAAIVSLAHNLGLSVVAGGVETERQRRCLADLGCDRIQGFMTGRPMPPEVASAWLHALDRTAVG